MRRRSDQIERVLASHQELLNDFVSEKKWGLKDAYWQELLTFQEPLSSISPKALEDALLPFCDRLVKTNGKTYNFQMLLQHMVIILQDDRNSMSVRRASDTVVFVSVFLKYLVESLNADDLVALLDAPQRELARQGRPSEDSWVNQIIAAMLFVLTTTHIGTTTYLLHLVAMRLLLVVFSTQLYTASPASDPGNHPFLEVMMDNKQLSERLLSILLQHLIDYRPLPPKAPLYQPVVQEQRGVFKLVRNAAVSVLWLPIQAITFFIRSRQVSPSLSPLADTSLLLLLAVVHHAPAMGHLNPFSTALQTLKDNKFTTEKSGSEDNPSVSGRDHSISYHSLYQSLSAHTDNEVAVLLLYDLLHCNTAFKGFVVGREDLDTLVLSLGKLLYSSDEMGSSQMYMLLIVILMLTQNPDFSRRVHQISLATVPWYQERVLKDITLGSLLMLLLIRIASHNLSKQREEHLTQNAIAALANLAPYMRIIASYTAQRLIQLIETLSKRHERLSSQSNAHHFEDEILFYSDTCKILLEVLNCTIIRHLPQNPELVYSLLHRQEVFERLQASGLFAEALENIMLVINHFNREIDLAREKSRTDWDVSKVMALIREKLVGWPGGMILRDFKELRFSYEEEESPEQFFVPYVWSLIVSHTQSSIPWTPEAIALFSPVTESNKATLDDLEDPIPSSKTAELHEALNNV